MNIIFDENQASQHKCQIHEEVFYENRRRAKKKVFLCITSVLLCIISVATIFSFNPHFTLQNILLVAGVLMLFGSPTAYILFDSDFLKVVFPSSKYTSDVQYLIATNNKRICSYNFIEHENTVDIALSVVNRVGKFEKEYIRGLKKEITDKVKETTIDFDNAVVYIPLSNY